MPTITIPNNWQPRSYQRKLWDYFENGGTRGIEVAHRRWGKDDVALHLAATKMVQRTGNYWHMLPEASQARKAIWDAINPHTAKKRIDEAFPLALRETTRNNEMSVHLKTGSTWQVVGSDNYNSLVGAPPVGIVFSEWALADPAAWAYLRPILLENGGWALFIYTPRGRNHGATFFEAHQGSKDWFVERLTARQTPVFTPKQLDSELEEYVAEYGLDDGTTRFNQEYLCDFQASVVGAFFAKELGLVERASQIGKVSYDSKLPVYTAWDIGIGDSTAIWFFQLLRQEIRCIDYLENHGVGVPWYANELKARGYSYELHILPHDGGADEFTSGMSAEKALHEQNMKNTRVLPRPASKMAPIQAARAIFSRCWFDETRCSRGLDCLRNYRREWDDKQKVYRDYPMHDWSSHGAEAFCILGSGLPEPRKPVKLKYQTDWVV